MALTRDGILGFLTNDLDVDCALDETTPLFSSSIIDSFAMMSLIEYVEKQASLRVPSGDVTLENLDTVARILAYVQRRAAAG